MTTERPPAQPPIANNTAVGSSVRFTGVPLENVYPPRKRFPLPHKDPRTLALEKFADFLSTLVFRRTNKVEPDGTVSTIPFRVRRADIHIEQPDNVRDLKFPSIAFIPATGTYHEFGLGPAQILDSTIDKFAPGTALIETAEYEETLILEVTAAKSAERRAIVGGIEVAMLNQDDSYALRFILPDLFDTTCSFALESRVLVETEAQRNRRVAQLSITMSVCLVQLINVTELKTFVTVDDC